MYYAVCVCVWGGGGDGTCYTSYISLSPFQCLTVAVLWPTHLIPVQGLLCFLLELLALWPPSPVTLGTHWWAVHPERVN